MRVENVKRIQTVQLQMTFTKWSWCSNLALIVT